MGDHPHLLAALREELDVTSPKDGCSPSGQCGCCTVLVDGKATCRASSRSRRWRAATVHHARGPPADERDRYAAAFAACGALQCGFCIPGIVMRAKAQIDKKGADLNRTDMARHLGAHLCRCTGYVKILDAIEVVAKGRPVEVGLPGRDRRPRREVRGRAELTLGDRDYVDDIRVPGMLHAALRLDRPRPGRRSVRIDAAARRGRARRGRRCSPPPTSPASCGSASSTPTGRCSSRSAGARRTPATSSPSSWPRPASRRAPRPRWWRSTTRCCGRSPIAVAAIDDPEIAVWGTDGNVLSGQRVRAGRRRRGPGRQRPRGARAVPDPAHRARLPRARVHARRARPRRGRRRAPARVLRRAGRVGRPQPDRVGPRRRPPTP